MRFVPLLIALALAGCLTSPVETPQDLSPTFHEFLEPGQAVHFQIDYAAGYPPSDLAMDALRAVADDIGLESRITAAHRIPNQAQFTFKQLLSLHRDLYEGSPATWRNANNEVVLHILYATDYADNDTAAGLQTYSFGTPLIVLFMDRLNVTSAYVLEVGALALSRDGRERAVLIHELGHAIGLVNCGLPQVLDRQDAERGCHSRDKNSSMYWALHNADNPAQWALDDEMQPIWKFSADDWADIRAFQGKMATEPMHSTPSPQSYTPPLSPNLSKSATKRSLGVD